MFVERIAKPSRARCQSPTIFRFEEHYALAAMCVQEVNLHAINIPTIDGFQCPTWIQDAGQNCLLKALLFTPWQCSNAMSCGSITNFQHMMARNTRKGALSASSASQPTNT